MASQKVKALIDAFRNHFRTGEQARIPLALRQEPVDVVYRALLEEDAPDAPPLTPLMGDPVLEAGGGFGPEAGDQAAQLLADMGGFDPLGGMDAPDPLGAMQAPAGDLPSVDDFLTEF